MSGGKGRGWRERLLGGRLLGGRTAPAPVPAPAPPTTATAGSARPPAAAPPKPKKPVQHVAVTVLGLTGEALEQVLAVAERQCAARGARPVFVTDGDDFAPFRRRRLIVDQVVDAEALAASAPDLAWRVYRRRQYALLAARWRPAAVISFGRQPDEDCLAALGGPSP